MDGSFVEGAEQQRPAPEPMGNYNPKESVVPGEVQDLGMEAGG